MKLSHHCRSAHRLAFTLVELLVVIAIISVLVLLLLPAVNAAREAARNTQCKNNIRQLALAVVNYEGTYGHFPVSQTASGKALPGNKCEGGFYSWHARILPFVEATNVYQQIDFDLDMADSCNGGEHGLFRADHPNANPASQSIDTFLCPSDFTASGLNEQIMGVNTGQDNYAGNAGWPSLTTGFNGERATPAKYNGLISVVNVRSDNKWLPKKGVRTKDVKDGLSKTACVAERMIQHGMTQINILNGSKKTLSYHITEQARTLGAMVERCRPENTHPDLTNSAYLGRSWISGWAPTGPTYMHVKEPNSNHCHFSHSDTTGDFIVTPTSNHPGGVNVAFADGHVSFVPDGVTLEVWWAMGSRNGGESHSLEL